MTSFLATKVQFFFYCTKYLTEIIIPAHHIRLKLLVCSTSRSDFLKSSCLPSFEMLLNCLENDEQSGDNEEQTDCAKQHSAYSAYSYSAMT